VARICMVLRGDIRYDGRVRKEIATLVRSGHQVNLVVSDFGRTESSGEDLGIKIHYVPAALWPSAARNFLEQLVFNRTAASIIKKLRPSHIHCHDLSSLLAGVWAKKKLGATLIFDAHELMPESMGGIRELVWGWIEKSCILRCDRIVMPETNRIAYFKRKYRNIPSPLLLQNFPRQADIPKGKFNLLRDIFSIKSEQKVILYTGLIAPKRSVDELISSMTICDEKFVLVIMGEVFREYDETLRSKIRKLRLEDRVFLHGPVPHAEVLRYMASCDIGTAFYNRSNLNNYYCAPNKVFEYIALGKPLLTNNYPGLLQTVEKFRQGVCLNEVTPKSLAEAYNRASDSKVIAAGTRKYFWEDEEHVLTELYEQKASPTALLNCSSAALRALRLG
jgi:glycosyltransferase involved in cell wall biosynthesis